jgi:hypothetical protein
VVILARAKTSAAAHVAAPVVVFMAGDRRSGAGLIPADEGPGGAAV